MTTGLSPASWVASSSSKTTKKKDSGVFGDIGGFFKNIGYDVKDAAFGIVPGIQQLILAPDVAFKGIWQHYANDSAWAALAHGNFKEFGTRLYEHPLGPILDVATIFTGGGAAAAKIGGMTTKTTDLAFAAQAAKAKGLVPKMRDPENPSFHIPWDNDIVENASVYTLRTQPANMSFRARQAVTDKLSAKFAEISPAWNQQFGAIAKYEKGLKKEVSARKRAVDVMPGVWGNAFAKGLERYTDAEIPMWGGQVFEKVGAGLRDHAVELKPSFEVLTGEKVNGQMKLFETPKKVETTKLPDGFVYIRENPNMPLITSVESFETAMKNFGKDFTTTSAAKAAKNEKGNYLMAYAHDAERWAQEGLKSGPLVRAIYRKPTFMWKVILLGTRPMYVINNMIGTTGMALATIDPIRFTMGFIDGLRATRGTKAASKFVDEGARLLDRGYKKKWYSDVYEGVFSDLEAQLKLDKSSKLAGKVNPKVSVLFKYTNKIEQVIRGLAIDEFLYRQPEVRALMRQGHSFEKAADMASKDRAFRAKVVQDTERRFGQYFHFNRAEQELRQLMPFYGWNRAIVAHTINMSAVRKNIGANLANVGLEAQGEQLGGRLPGNYLAGLIPIDKEGEKALGFVPGRAGRMPVLSASSLNPWAAFGEIWDTATGEPTEMMQGINPIITAAASQVAGKQLTTGEPLKDRMPIGGPVGVLGNIYSQIIEGLPQFKLAASMAGKSDTESYTTSSGVSQDFLFSRRWQELLAAYIGVPVKQVSLTALDRKRSLELKKKLGEL